MTRKRRERLVNRVVSSVSPALEPQQLCELCAEVTAMSGAGIMLMSDDMSRGSLSTADPVTARIEALQFTLGEGPCVDAYNQGHPIFESHLAEPTTPRWPAFSTPAVEAGAQAVFGFPLRVGGVRIGALDLHSTRPGPLKAEQHLDALILANVVADAILLVQAETPPALLAAELQAGTDFQTVVNQASGMVAVQLNVSVGQALIRLRMHAFGAERPLVDVAHDVVVRRLRFDTDLKSEG